VFGACCAAVNCAASKTVFPFSHLPGREERVGGEGASQILLRAATHSTGSPRRFLRHQSERTGPTSPANRRRRSGAKHRTQAKPPRANISRQLQRTPFKQKTVRHRLDLKWSRHRTGRYKRHRGRRKRKTLRRLSSVRKKLMMKSAAAVDDRPRVEGFKSGPPALADFDPGQRVNGAVTSDTDSDCPKMAKLATRHSRMESATHQCSECHGCILWSKPASRDRIRITER